MKKSIFIPLLGICLMLASCGGDSSSSNTYSSSNGYTPYSGYTPNLTSESNNPNNTTDNNTTDNNTTNNNTTNNNTTDNNTNAETEITKQAISLLNSNFDGEASYSIQLVNSEKKITLNDTATIKRLDNGNFQYDYSYQYLNSLDGDSDELISTISDSIIGDLNSVISSSNFNTYSNASARMILEFKFYQELISECKLLNIGSTKKITGTFNSDFYNSTFNVSGSDYKFELAFDSTQNIISYLTINYKTNNFNISIDIDY